MTDITTVTKKYFVYALCYPNGAPFYIGKGTGNRVNFHLKEAASGSLSDKSVIIRSITEAGDQVKIRVFFESDDEMEVLRYEKKYIFEFEYLYPLCNRVHAKKKDKQKCTATRWSFPELLHRKIAVYQVSHGIPTMEEAANILLDKATEHINLEDYIIL
jgi:hypothetical protein